MAEPGPSAARFPGFPEGRLLATVLPSLFFSEVVGQIDDLGELKLALYLFWRIGQKKSYPRFVTRREVEADPIIRAGLAHLGEEALGRALERVVERGLLLRRRMELGGTIDECYFVNSAGGRRAVRDLESGRLDLGQVVLPEEGSVRRERATVFRLYEENVGLLTPLIIEALREAERRYPGEWIEDAFRQAVAYNRRNWRYIQRILERWAVEGKDDEVPWRRSPRPRAASTDRPGRHL